jgi:hypothetical protein
LLYIHNLKIVLAIFTKSKFTVYHYWYFWGIAMSLSSVSKPYYFKHCCCHKIPESCNQVFFCLFVLLWFTTRRQSIGHMTTFQRYWWRKTSGALSCIISGTNCYLSRTTTNVPYAIWVTSSHKIAWILNILYILSARSLRW